MPDSHCDVLIVEDEESFVEGLVIGLKREGFRVHVARTGTEALVMFRQIDPDIILLDVMLPEMSGVDVCRAIRATSKVPIIMVTAKTGEIDTVVGLEVGADDYVTKPYRTRELVARMRAVLRRTPAAPMTPDNESVVEIADVRLDVASHQLQVRGATVAIPLKEFEVLQLLMENAGRVLTREQLMDRVWGLDYVGDTKTLDVHIKRLRSRVEEDPSSPAKITTIRGLGYRFERL